VRIKENSTNLADSIALPIVLCLVPFSAWHTRQRYNALGVKANCFQQGIKAQLVNAVFGIFVTGETPFMAHQGHAAQQNESAETPVRRATNDVTGEVPQQIIRRAHIDPQLLKPTNIKQLQRTIGNRATARLMFPNQIIQPKLKLGPADDPYEREADQVAEQVTRQIDSTPVQRHEDEETMQRQIAPPPMAKVSRRVQFMAETVCRCPACSGPSEELTAQAKFVDTVQRHANDHQAGCGCASCSSTSGDLTAQAKFVDTIQRRSNDHHTACGCPSCGHIQRKEAAQQQSTREATDPQATPVQRQPITQNVLAKGRQSTAAFPQVDVHNGVAGGSPVIQRHSSWEHKSLGDANPEDLAKIGAWQDLIDQTKEQVVESGFLGWGKKTKRDKEIGSVNIEGVDQPISKANVMHVLAQELARLDKWQTNPPTKGSTGEIDSDYQTVLVLIPGGGKDAETPLVVTYGELNTLADYYGNIDAMKTADRDIRWRIVQSVRKETFLRLRDIYNQLKKSLTEAEKKAQAKELSETEEMMGKNKINQDWTNQFMFAGSIQQDYISSVAGQVNLLKKSGTGAQEKTDNYSATLARNACHFVPESWHAWSNYHQQARAKAEDARDLESALGMSRLFANNNPTEEEREQQAEDERQLQADYEAAVNEAILLNGFGDHYLQDSYAAGHMINKTLIMKWFVEYLDSHSDKLDFASNENWRKVQAIAYRQPGLATAISGDSDQYDKREIQGYSTTKKQNKAQNPQAVEDIKGDDWMVRFKALGLQVPESLRTAGSDTRELFEAWQGQVVDNPALRTMKGATLVNTGKNIGFDYPRVHAALTKLLSDGIIHSGYDTGLASDLMQGKKSLSSKLTEEDLANFDFIMRTEYVPSNKERFEDAINDDSDDKYQEMAAMVTYQDYFAFMNNGYLQKSTNALHNKFCLDGLEITSADGSLTGARVYGDDAMFNKGSEAGVKHSAETAHMSRDAIRNIISTGRDQGLSTAKILNRLPDKVEGVDIAVWHNPAQGGKLKAQAFKIFESEMGVIDKAVGAMGDLTAFLHKDQVHKGEAF
jgi:hypothetical protein